MNHSSSSIIVRSAVLAGVFSNVLATAGLGSETAGPLQFPNQAIQVDADPSDWKGIQPHVASGENHLWFGQGMTREKWTGNRDLSYQWRGAWHGSRLFFLIEVTDDNVAEALQPSSYLCDCVEIYIDYGNRGGKRVTVLDGRKDWFEKYDSKEIMGYEMHFLPTKEPLVFLDHRGKYATSSPHNVEFAGKWQGEVKTRRTKTGYITELAFAIPASPIELGKTIGVEIGVCDDDGKSRESIMMWPATMAEFWIDMGGYAKVRLAGPTSAEPESE
jgi:hypothetical protein